MVTSAKRKIYSKLFSNAWGLGWGERIFLAIRWMLTPYSQILAQAQLKAHNRAFDVASGHGLLAIYLASQNSELKVVAIDHDKNRIAAASRASQELANLDLFDGDLSKLPDFEKPFDAIFAIDVIHYFDYDTQKRVLSDLKQKLNTEGTFLMRELIQDRSLSYYINFVYEKFATAAGLTKSKNTHTIYLRSRKDWENLLEELGYTVKSFRCGSIAFNDFLFVAKLKKVS